MTVSLKINPLEDTWVVSGFWLLWIKLLWMFMYKFLFGHNCSLLWNKWPRVQLLAGIINPFLVFKETVKLFCRMIVYNLFFFFQKKGFIYLFLERGERREKDRKRSINVQLPLACPLLETWPETQACALTGNRNVPFVSQANTQTTELYQPGLQPALFFKNIFYWLCYYSCSIPPLYSPPSCIPPPTRIPPSSVHVHGLCI